MAIESLERGGCRAADAISHAEAAKSRISASEAAKFAMIAGKKRFENIKSPSERKISRESKNSFQKRF